jgi:hypothetical protein
MFRYLLLTILTLLLFDSSLSRAGSFDSCSQIFEDGIELLSSDIRSTLDAIGRDLIRENPDVVHSDSFDEPFNAFFRRSIDLEFPDKSRVDPKDISVEEQKVGESWTRPVLLSPMPVVVYKGHLFPSSYFLRRTRYFNAFGAMKFNAPYDIAEYGEHLPFVEPTGSNSYALHRTGGSKKLLELITRDLPEDGKLNLYRAVSGAEADVQLLIHRLLIHGRDKRISPTEIAELKRVSVALSPQSEQTNRFIAEIEKNRPTRLMAARGLAGILSGSYHSTFTSTSFEGASEFLSADTDRVISYQVPIQKLQQMVGPQLYVGLESDDPEFAFIDEPNEQVAKLTLFENIIGVSSKGGPQRH